MSSISVPQPLIRQLPPSLARLAREKPLLFTFGAIGTLTGLGWAIRDYTRWKALGPGGLPFNPFGWLRACFLTPIATSQRRITDTTELDRLVRQIANEEGEKAVFRRLTLVQRRGGRPKVRGVIPQRQVDDLGSKALTEQVNVYLVFLASEYPTLLRIAPSVWEGGHADALFIRRSPAASSSSPSLSSRTLANAAPRLEIAHVHASDGALHLPLSPADAAEVIGKGWGVRHRLSGRMGVPSTFVFVYAPRDTEELAVVKRIVAASVEYTTGLSKVA